LGWSYLEIPVPIDQLSMSKGTILDI
jgi:hypothetical protein